MAVERKKYCVCGEWRTSKTDTYMPVTDSSTGQIIAEVPRCTREEVEEAVASAQEAFPAWSQMSLSRRTQMMFKWREVLMAHLDELTLLCSQELGKNLNEARGDILKAIEPTEFACSLPLGVVAGIVPFNFPAMIPWGWRTPTLKAPPTR